MQLSAENTAIVLDSTADCPDPQARHANWRMVPLYVRFGDETLREYVDITPEEFYRRLRESPEPPKSSQPTPADFAAAYEELTGYERIVAVLLSAKLSGTFESARLAAEHGALSADQLEYTDEDGVAAMARAGTVAVLLPGAFYVLREKQLPPVEALRRHGVPIALATDSNPGTSPITSLLLTMNMAATLFRLTVDEALAGVTREAARALGRLADIGTLEPGKRCDLAVWDIERPAELVYRIGFNPLHARVRSGR